MEVEVWKKDLERGCCRENVEWGCLEKWSWDFEMEMECWDLKVGKFKGDCF